MRRAQLLPAERLKRRFAQSPIDALIDLQVECRLRRQIPVRPPRRAAWHARATLMDEALMLVGA